MLKEVVNKTKGVDGCEYYVRLIGDEKDHEKITKIAKTPKNPTPKI